MKNKQNIHFLVANKESLHINALIVINFLSRIVDFAISKVYICKMSIGAFTNRDIL